MLVGKASDSMTGAPKKLVICVDSDGCALPILRRRNKRPVVCPQAWGVNSEIVKYIKTKIASGQYSEVIIGSFSMRQTLKLDKQGASIDGAGSARREEGSGVIGSSAPMLVGLAQEVKKALGEEDIPVNLFKGLLGDVYQVKELGTVFQQMLTQATLRNPRSTEHNIPIFGYSDDRLNPADRKGHFDYTKLNILYFLVHAINQQNPDCQLDFHLWDSGKSVLGDGENILDTLWRFLSNESPDASALSIFPSNVTLSAHQYDLYDDIDGKDATSSPEIARWTLQGQGSPAQHTDYCRMLRDLRAKISDYNEFNVGLAEAGNEKSIIALHKKRTTVQSKVEQVDAQQNSGCGIWQFFKEKLHRKKHQEEENQSNSLLQRHLS